MMWLPDTNVWIRYLNSAASSVAERLRNHPANRIVLCDVVKAELLYGAFRSARREQNLALLDNLFKGFPALPFDEKAARIFGRVRADLADKGTPIGPYDLQIAAIALANGCTLVTHNTSEFARVEGLAIEDWEAA